jgi:biopolymer transport protein ExbB
MSMNRSRRLIPVLLGLAWLGLAALAAAQDATKGDDSAVPQAEAQAEPTTTPSQGPAAVGRRSILRLVSAANPMLWPLVLCSVVTLGFTLERLVALRRGRIIPKDFVTRFSERLATGKLDRERAAELCKANDSPVARIFAHAVRYWGQPSYAIRQALDADAAGEVVDLKRNVRVLNGTATLAPLLGLLGTVIGMIESFDALGVGGPGGASKSEQLAQGISLALFTTAFGLAIAVVSVVAYYYLLNRVDVLVRELDEQANRVIDLIAGESARPIGDRRGGFMSDLGRMEPRTLGRSDSLRSES